MTLSELNGMPNPLHYAITQDVIATRWQLSDKLRGGRG